MKKKTTLRHSIILNNLIAITIPIILFGIFSVQVYISNYADATASKNKIIADTLRDQYTTILKEPLNLLSLTEDELQDLSQISPSHMNLYLSNIVKVYDYIINIEVMDENGLVIYTGVDYERNIGANRTGESFYNYFQDSPELDTFWSSPYISTSTEELTLHISKKNKQNHYITVYINLQTLSNTSLEFTKAFDDDLEIAITDEYGIYISHSDITKVYMRLFEPEIDSVKRKVDNNETYAVIEYGDGPYVVSASVMDQTGWYIIIYQPYATTFAFINELILLLSLVILIGITIASVYTIIYAKRIDLFIQSMNNEMDMAITNKYKINLPEFDYEDFNKMSVNFNQLMFEIGKRDDKLFDMAYKDSLTGLGNRAHLLEYIENNITQRPEKPFTYAHIDIDNFKIINDLYGHEIGDLMIQYIGKKLPLLLNNDRITINRLAGDEFGIVIDALLTEKDFLAKLQPLCDELKNGVSFEDRMIRTTISGGLAAYPSHSTDLKTLLQYTDIALLEAKSGGKNGFKLYNSQMKERIQSRSRTDSLLRKAIVEKLFELHFQPQISTLDGRITGFEALVRLRDQNGNIIPPYRFIPIAEESGLILEIGTWIIEDAITKIMEINELYKANYSISINLSNRQIQEQGFAGEVINIVNKTGIEHSLVEFEMTESVFSENYNKTKETLMTLRQEGLRLALDDFGTGYSSLSYLANLPFNVLKIDRSFIADVENNEQKHSLLEFVVQLGHKLEQSIVAEGVETIEQLNIVKNFGCDTIQGYLYSRPLPYDQLKKYIQNFDKR